jgi:hypothetical protein
LYLLVVVLLCGLGIGVDGWQGAISGVVCFVFEETTDAASVGAGFVDLFVLSDLVIATAEEMAASSSFVGAFRAKAWWAAVSTTVFASVAITYETIA